MRPTVLSRVSLAAYRSMHRIRSKAFSVLVGGAFASFGRHSVITLPVRLLGERRIAIGEDVFLGPNCWLQAFNEGDVDYPSLYVGNRTSIAGGCIISAVRNVTLEADVLVASNVYISDHIHAYSRTDVPVQQQGVTKVKPVLIKRGAWLGQNVVVCPGVTIGTNSVIGANAVVTRDIPDHCLAVGTPASVVKRATAE